MPKGFGKKRSAVVEASSPEAPAAKKSRSLPVPLLNISKVVAAAAEQHEWTEKTSRKVQAKLDAAGIHTAADLPKSLEKLNSRFEAAGFKAMQPATHDALRRAAKSAAAPAPADAGDGESEPEHPGLGYLPTMRYPTPTLQPMPTPLLVPAQPLSPRGYLGLPGAQGRLHNFLKHRVTAVARAVGGDAGAAGWEAAALRVLPHLAPRAPHQLVPVDAGRADIAAHIDHTVLKPDVRRADIAKLCAEAEKHRFFAVCVNSSRVADCAMLLRETKVDIAAVVGFPLGAMLPALKAAEAAAAVAAGAAEIDMVLNVGWLQDGEYANVLADIAGVVRATPGGRVKVILETCLLTDEQIADACIISAMAGAEFVKTSTGFSKGGATPEAVDIMKATVGARCKVKASGGVRDAETARKYIEAGVSRIGTSSGIKIIEGEEVKGGY